MNAIPVVDSHVHLWDPGRFRYPWLDGLPALNRSYLPHDFAAASQSANVDKMIFVECGCIANQSADEVNWISGLATEEPRLKGIVAAVQIEKVNSIQTELAGLAANPLVKGVRRNLQGEQDAQFMLQPEFVSGIARLAEFGFTFDVCVRHDQLPALIELVRRVPQVTFVLDHLGKPDVRSGCTRPWQVCLEGLAQLPNVACKISGLTTEADWNHWQASDLRPYVDAAVDCFGFDRILFGGDWPVATLATSYARWLEVLERYCDSWSGADRVKFYRTNAERIYRV